MTVSSRFVMTSDTMCCVSSPADPPGAAQCRASHWRECCVTHTHADAAHTRVSVQTPHSPHPPTSPPHPQKRTQTQSSGCCWCWFLCAEQPGICNPVMLMWSCFFLILCYAQAVYGCLTSAKYSLIWRRHSSRALWFIDCELQMLYSRHLIDRIPTWLISLGLRHSLAAWLHSSLKAEHLRELNSTTLVLLLLWFLSSFYCCYQGWLNSFPLWCLICDKAAALAEVQIWNVWRSLRNTSVILTACFMQLVALLLHRVLRSFFISVVLVSTRVPTTGLALMLRTYISEWGVHPLNWNYCSFYTLTLI